MDVINIGRIIVTDERTVRQVFIAGDVAGAAVDIIAFKRRGND